MNKKLHFKWNPLALFPLIGLALLLIFFSYYFPMNADPDAFNPFPTDMTGEAYFHTFGNAISVSFAAILFFYFIFLALDLLFRQESSHILLTLIGEAIISAYCICKTVWMFGHDFVRQTMALVFLIVASISLIAMHYFFLKKSLDGDHDSIYTIVLFVAGIALFFGVVQYDSLLDSYSHLGDLVFWGDWGVAHLAIVTYVGLAFINLTSDYDPEPLELNDTHVDLSKGN